MIICTAVRRSIVSWKYDIVWAGASILSSSIEPTHSSSSEQLGDTELHRYGCTAVKYVYNKYKYFVINISSTFRSNFSNTAALQQHSWENKMLNPMLPDEVAAKDVPMQSFLGLKELFLFSKVRKKQNTETNTGSAGARSKTDRWCRTTEDAEIQRTCTQPSRLVL